MFQLADLPAWAFGFALVLCRCGATAMLLPGIAEAETPTVVRAGIAVGLVVLILPGVGPLSAPDGWACARMVTAELLCGGVLGWLSRCVTLALPMAGQLISFMTGLSSVISPDPALGQSSAVMRLLSLVVPVITLQSGLWAMPVAALSGSYGLVPPGHFLPMADSSSAIMIAIIEAFELALRLAAPFIVASVVWQVALGLVARLVPPLQIHFAAMPGQILGGLALLAMLSGGIIAAWKEAAQVSLSGLPGLP